MNQFQFRKMSTLLSKNLSYSDINFTRRKWNSIKVPHRALPEPKGEDFDFVNVVHTHLIHSHWESLENICSGINTFRLNHILLKTQNDYVLSHEFFKWVSSKNPSFVTLESNAIMLHILTKHEQFEPAEVILRDLLDSASGCLKFPNELFDAITHSYMICSSSKGVFDSLLKTYAHLKKFRQAMDAYCRMKQYGFLPTIESCNALLSSLTRLNRRDNVLAFYREMCRCKISPNVFTLNMVMDAFFKTEKFKEAVQLFKEMETMGISPDVTSYNVLIDGYGRDRHLYKVMKLKSVMEKKGIHPNRVSYNLLLNYLCEEKKLQQANKLFHEMKERGVSPDLVTYNTLIEHGSCEARSLLFEEMLHEGIVPDKLTYTALISGLCKQRDTRKVAFLVRQFDRNKLIRNASTVADFQSARKNSDRAFQYYKSMVGSGYYPDKSTLRKLISMLVDVEDYDAAIQVMKDMIDRNIIPGSSDVSRLCNKLCCCGREKAAVDLSKEIEIRKGMSKESYDAL